MNELQGSDFKENGVYTDLLESAMRDLQNKFYCENRNEKKCGTTRKL